MMHILVVLLGILTVFCGIGVASTLREYREETHLLTKLYLASAVRRTTLVFILFLIAFLLTAHQTFSS
jgi:hypothetical protein